MVSTHFTLIYRLRPVLDGRGVGPSCLGSAVRMLIRVCLRIPSDDGQGEASNHRGRRRRRTHRHHRCKSHNSTSSPGTTTQNPSFMNSAWSIFRYFFLVMTLYKTVIFAYECMQFSINTCVFAQPFTLITYIRSVRRCTMGGRYFVCIPNRT